MVDHVPNAQIIRFRLTHFFFFKQKTAYDVRISDCSSDVCSSALHHGGAPDVRHQAHTGGLRHATIFFISVKPPQPQTSGCSRSSLWRRTWVRTALLNLLHVSRP